MAKDNKSLGKFQLNGIPPAPRGVPQIEVSFDIDANGILKVSARDKGTGREQSVSITNTGGLSGSEIERMKQEALVYEEEDERRKRLVELKNQADTIFYSYEVTLRDNGEFISDELKAQASDRAVDLKAVIANSAATLEEVKQALDSFQQTLLMIGEDVYRRANQTQSSDEPTVFAPESTATQLGQTVQAGSDSDLDDDDYSFDNDATVTADYEAVD